MMSRSHDAMRRVPCAATLRARAERRALRFCDRACPSPLRAPHLAACCALLLLVSPPLSANPIVIFPSEYGWVAARDHVFLNFACVVVSALCVEYLVFRLLFRRHLTRGRALVAFLDIHFVSWPITFALSLFLGLFNVFGLIPITEVFPIWYEGRRYRKLLGVRSARGLKLMYRSAMIANLSSYLVGVVYLRALGH